MTAALPGEAISPDELAPRIVDFALQIDLYLRRSAVPQAGPDANSVIESFVSRHEAGFAAAPDTYAPVEEAAATVLRVRQAISAAEHEPITDPEGLYRELSDAVDVLVAAEENIGSINGETNPAMIERLRGLVDHAARDLGVSNVRGTRPDPTPRRAAAVPNVGETRAAPETSARGIARARALADSTIDLSDPNVRANVEAARPVTRLLMGAIRVRMEDFGFDPSSFEGMEPDAQVLAATPIVIQALQKGDIGIFGWAGTGADARAGFEWAPAGIDAETGQPTPRIRVGEDGAALIAGALLGLDANNVVSSADAVAGLVAHELVHDAQEEGAEGQLLFPAQARRFGMLNYRLSTLPAAAEATIAAEQLLIDTYKEVMAYTTTSTYGLTLGEAVWDGVKDDLEAYVRAHPSAAFQNGLAYVYASGSFAELTEWVERWGPLGQAERLELSGEDHVVGRSGSVGQSGGRSPTRRPAAEVPVFGVGVAGESTGSLSFGGTEVPTQQVMEDYLALQLGAEAQLSDYFTPEALQYAEAVLEGATDEGDLSVHIAAGTMADLAIAFSERSQSPTTGARTQAPIDGRRCGSRPLR